MEPLVLGLGVPELLIILAVVLLLFGGSRLAGLGKSTGRALKEFKEETKGLKADDGETAADPASLFSRAARPLRRRSSRAVRHHSSSSSRRRATCRIRTRRIPSLRSAR